MQCSVTSLQQGLCCAAACHSGGGNVIEASKTLQKDAISQYLDGGLSVSHALPYLQSCKEYAMSLHWSTLST